MPEHLKEMGFPSVIKNGSWGALPSSVFQRLHWCMERRTVFKFHFHHRLQNLCNQTSFLGAIGGRHSGGCGKLREGSFPIGAMLGTGGGPQARSGSLSDLQEFRSHGNQGRRGHAIFRIYNALRGVVTHSCFECVCFGAVTQLVFWFQLFLILNQINLGRAKLRPTHHWVSGSGIPRV